MIPYVLDIIQSLYGDLTFMFWSGVFCGYVATALMYRKLMYKEVNTICEENSNFKRKIKIVNKAFMKNVECPHFNYINKKCRALNTKCPYNISI